MARRSALFLFRLRFEALVDRIMRLRLAADFDGSVRRNERGHDAVARGRLAQQRLAALESEEEATRALLEKCRARLVEITNEKFDLGLAEIVRLRREKEAAGEWDGLRPKLEKVLQ
jgi:hypothetical protein